MKALNLVAYNQFECGDAPDPEPGPGEVVIAVKACGICGSDIHGMDGSSGRRIPPIIMGHEASGVIASLGTEVTNWQTGDRVTFDSMVHCGQCQSCKNGKSNLCSNRRVLGVSCEEYRQQGAFAELLKLPAHLLHKLPENLSFEQGAFAEPVSIALHAVNRVPAGPGKSAVVVGVGMIGILVVQALRMRGCDPVYAIDLDPKKLQLACSLGAQEGFLASEADPVAMIRQRNLPDGVDIAMEAVGIAPSVATAIQCVKKGGAVGLIGNLAAEIPFALQAVVTREISLLGSCACAGEYPEALKCIADGNIQVEPLLSKVAPLSEGAHWFEKLYKAEGNLMKVVLVP